MRSMQEAEVGRVMEPSEAWLLAYDPDAEDEGEAGTDERRCWHRRQPCHLYEPWLPRAGVT